MDATEDEEDEDEDEGDEKREPPVIREPDENDTVKIGPVKARWKGKVRLSDFDPPNSYRISGEGDGGCLLLLLRAGVPLARPRSDVNPYKHRIQLEK